MSRHLVTIIGGGPSGLACATTLAQAGRTDVTVIEREAEAGGIPRHCFHTGFGWFDLHRIASGPGYARKRVALARAAGVTILTETTALAMGATNQIVTTSARGVQQIPHDALVLATGCRERPRSARRVPGSRPAGVLTTGALQQLVYFGHVPIGRKAVVIGAEHVSYSAVETLLRGGAQVVAIVTEHRQSQTYRPFHWLVAGRRGIALRTCTRIVGIEGRQRVNAIIVTGPSGLEERIECDTVVFTGDWIPDYELARTARLPMDPGTLGPTVDGALRTGHPGVFAVGNLVHAAEMADLAALGGVRAAGAVAEYLRTGEWRSETSVPVTVASPLAWVYPNMISPGLMAPYGRYVLRTSAFHDTAWLVARQGDRKLGQVKRRRLVPNRSLHFAAGFEADVDPTGGPVTINIEEA